MNSILRYDYNLPWRGAVIGAIFYAGLSFFMAHLAKGGAGVVFFGLIALSVMFAILALFMIARRLVFPRVLEVNDDAILFPHGFPKTRITRISYADIIWMRGGGLVNHPSFCMTTARGSFEIGAARFTDIESYRAVKDFIYSKASVEMANKDEQAEIRAAFLDPIQEPAAWPRYRRHLVVSGPLLPRLAKALWFFGRCLGIIFLPWIILRLFQMPTVSIAEFLGLSVSATLFFTLLHWLNATYPARATRITVHPNGITQLSGKQTFNWNYRNFSGWAVVERQFEGRILHILMLKCPTYVVTFALPDTSTRDRFMQLLHDKKIPQLPDLKPSWE
jgi:hypothetical protein